MHSTLLSQAGGTRVCAVIFRGGEEVMEGLRRVAGEQALTAASFTGIGAFKGGCGRRSKW